MISSYDWFGYDLAMKERYELIKRTGFDGVLLWWSNDFGRDLFGKDDYKKGPELARKTGLIVENIHTPVEREDKLWLDNLEGESVLNNYLQCITDCYEHEIPTMVVHLPGESYEHNALGLDRIKTLTAKAEKLEVNVAFENLSNLSNLDYILGQINSKRIGFCYDCGHHYHFYPKEDLLDKYGSRMMALHLHDNNGVNGQHGLPLDGSLDWQKIMTDISAANYNGSIAIEAMNWDYMYLTIEAFLKKAFETAKQLETL